MLIKDYMTSSPVTVREDSDYKSAFEMMSEYDIHHLPVVNDSDEVVGILALRDLKIAAGYFNQAPVEIAEIMHAPVLTAKCDAPMSTAADKMIECKIGCLPVLNDDNQLAGILTETDLFCVLRDLLNKDS